MHVSEDAEARMKADMAIDLRERSNSEAIAQAIIIIIIIIKRMLLA